MTIATVAEMPTRLPRSTCVRGNRSRVFAAVAGAAIATLGIVSKSSASLVAYEPFAYSNGNLPTTGTNNDPGQTGFADNSWSDTTGSGNHSAMVSSPSLVTGNSSYDQNSTGGYVAVYTTGSSGTTSNTAAYQNILMPSVYDFLPSESAASGTTTGPGSIFVSCLIQPLQTTGNGAGMLELYNSSNTGSGGAIVKAGYNYGSGAHGYWGMTTFDGATGSSYIGFGYGTNSSETSNSVAFAQAVSTASPSLLVLELTYTTNGQDSVTEWINPTSTSSIPVAVTTGVTGLKQIDGIELLQSSGSGGTSYTSNFDEIRIGGAFSDVVPTPEPATISLLAGLGAAATLKRRRRVTRA